MSKHGRGNYSGSNEILATQELVSMTGKSAISSAEVRLYAAELTLLFQGSTGSSEGYKLFRDTDGIIAILHGIVVME